jgi:ankyrin repeat protein
VDSRDAQGRTPLFVAASYGNLEVAEALLNAKADPMARDMYGHQPMHQAVCADDLEMVDLLMSFGVSVNVLSDHHGESPLQLAAVSGTPEMVAFLLQNGADVNIRDNSGLTPLRAASARAKSRGTIELLRRAGAD